MSITIENISNNNNLNDLYKIMENNPDNNKLSGIKYEIEYLKLMEKF